MVEICIDILREVCGEKNIEENIMANDSSDFKTANSRFGANSREQDVSAKLS